VDGEDFFFFLEERENAKPGMFILENENKLQ
jgi:hypothetical protein